MDDKIFNSETNEQHLIVYKKPVGRLGNLLFQYASTLGIANLNKRFAFFDERMLELKNTFPRITINVAPKDIPMSIVKEKGLWDFDSTLFNLPKKTVSITGFLQSFRYFEDISRNLINSIFSSYIVSKSKLFY